MARHSELWLSVAAFAISAVSVTAPAHAAACWSQADVSAAKVHELQARLLAAAKECQASGVDILASYDKFVAARHAALIAADDRLKAHFLSSGDDLGYDRYAAALDQAYGTTEASQASCTEAAALVQEVTSARDDLTTVAAREIDTATLPSSLCPVDRPVVLAAR